MKYIRTTGLAVLLLILLFGLYSCTDATADTVNLNIDNLDLQVVLPPGYPATVEGSTLSIQGYQGRPTVHSYPKYSGVENQGDIGIGSAAGYDVNDSFYIPINANLGGMQLSRYKICITIDAPAALQLAGISGSNQYLSQYYPEQYTRAPGFEKVPQKSDSPFCIWDTAGVAATGKINLAELQLSIVQTLPASGVNLTVEITELQDGSGNDLCPNLSASGCSPKNGVIIRNFLIKN